MSDDPIFTILALFTIMVGVVLVAALLAALAWSLVAPKLAVYGAKMRGRADAAYWEAGGVRAESGRAVALGRAAVVKAEVDVATAWPKAKASLVRGASRNAFDVALLAVAAATLVTALIVDD